MLGVPIAIWLLIAGAAGTAASPLLIKAYRRLVTYVRAKTGVDLPEGVAVDRRIKDVLGQVLPMIIIRVADGKLTPEEAKEILAAVVKLMVPEAATTAIAAKVEAKIVPKLERVYAKVPGISRS